MRCSLLSSLFVGSLLLGHRAAFAQATPAYDPNVVHRSVNSLQLWPELQGEVALRNGDYLLLALRGERITANTSQGFDAGRVVVGYEHFWNTRWSWGGTARYESSSSLNFSSYSLLIPEVLLRHRSPIFGGLTFGQRLSVERRIPVNTNAAGGVEPSGEFWGRLRVDVERFFFLHGDAGLALRPRLSYEAYTHLRLQKEATDAEERTIQVTSLRGEVGVRVSPHLDFTPWFAYQTGYLYTLPQYDKNMIQIAGGRENDVYPTIGLDLRFTLLPTGVKANRQQLPTQH